MSSSMLFLKNSDRKLFDWLVSTGVFSKAEFNSWIKPEEGYLMPLLIQYSNRIDDNLWINSALKSNPNFIHIPNLFVDQEFKNSFSSTLRKNLLNDYYISPIAQHGPTKWFALGYFLPFSINAFCDSLNLKPSQVKFNIETPRYFSFKQ